jgi:transcriptional regulator with GAF, ATPase, and Fis domain
VRCEARREGCRYGILPDVEQTSVDFEQIVRFELADMDEVANNNSGPAAQTFTRTQEQELERLGRNLTRQAHVWLVAARNRNLRRW